MSFFNGKPTRRPSTSESGEPTDPYLRMRGKLWNLLNKENNPNTHSLSNPLGQLLSELEEFHEYYINKYSNLKGEYDGLAQRMAASEQRLGLEIERLCLALQQSETEKDRLKERARVEPVGFGVPGESLHRFYETIQHSIKQANRAESQQYQDQIKTLKDKLSNLLEEKAVLQQKLEALNAECSTLKLKLKEYEIEQKYQAERINNSTFSLKMELAAKDQAVGRLQRELDFLKVRESPSRSSLPQKEAVTDLNNFFTEEGVEAILSGTSRGTLKLVEPLHPPFFEERISLTQKQAEPKAHELTQKKQDKGISIHRRHLSSTLSSPQDCPGKGDLGGAGNSELKIKILRLERFRKK